MLTAGLQEVLALLVVVAVVLALLIRWVRGVGAPWVARRLLNHGQVKWAMRVRSCCSERAAAGLSGSPRRPQATNCH